MLKDLININIIKLQVTEWVKRGEDIKAGTESVKMQGQSLRR